MREFRETIEILEAFIQQFAQDNRAEEKPGLSLSFDQEFRKIAGLRVHPE